MAVNFGFRMQGGRVAKAKKKVHIPQRPHEFDAEWFNTCLPFDGVVSKVVCEEIGTDVGFIGEVYRCHLSWQSNDGSFPASVIVKVPTQNDENFALGDGLQLYEREIMVYQELAPSLGLPMPGYLYGELDPDPAPWLERPVLFLFDRLPIRGINWLIAQFLKLAGKSKRRYVLVLEDVVDARPPTQAAGGSLDDACAALEVLAAFHAHNWMRSEVVDSQKRVWPIDRACRVYEASYLRNLDAFRARYRARVGDDVLTRLDEIQERATKLNRDLGSAPWTLLHGDYRLDNLLFRPDGEIVVLDHQGLAYGRPAVDVAYFVTTALNIEHRDEEQMLLHTYHDALVEAGVTGYSFEELGRDCGKAKEVFAHRIVGAADILDTEMSDGSTELLEIMQLRTLGWLDSA